MAGTVFWITGLSGAGKSTIGKMLVDALKEEGHTVLYLDGDTLRAIFNASQNLSGAERLELAFLYSRLCREIAMQNINVVCSTISLFKEIHVWNRESIPNYLEIYLRVPLAELEKRDSKGLYASAKEGIIKNVAGLDLIVDEPENPDLVVENYGVQTPKLVVKKIIDHFHE